MTALKTVTKTKTSKPFTALLGPGAPVRVLPHTLAEVGDGYSCEMLLVSVYQEGTLRQVDADTLYLSGGRGRLRWA